MTLSNAPHLKFALFSTDAFQYVLDDAPRDFEFLQTVGLTMFHGLRVMERAGIVHRGKRRRGVLYSLAVTATGINSTHLFL